MMVGLVFALIACFIWGTIFVIPQLIADFSPMEVALGRYLCYGAISFFLFFRKKISWKSAIKKHPKDVWKKAFQFALFSNILYYPALVLGLRYATSTVTVLIMGICPILVAFYGNWKGNEGSFRNLIRPSFWILLGLFLVNAIGVWQCTNPLWQYLLGILGAVSALCSWSYFAVHNARFLKANPEMPRTEWSTLIGLATFACSAFLLLLLGFIPHSGVDFQKFASLSLLGSIKFFLCVAFLGIFCSWLGCYLWNEASSHLPISVMGPLIIFETIFGLLFVFIFETRLPTLLELGGIIAMLYGIMGILKLFRKPAVI